MLMCSSKRIEKQIKDIQDKAENVKTEVYRLLSLALRDYHLIAFVDHTNPIIGTAAAAAAATSGSSINRDTITSNKIPVSVLIPAS